MCVVKHFPFPVVDGLYCSLRHLHVRCVSHYVVGQLDVNVGSMRVGGKGLPSCEHAILLAVELRVRVRARADLG